VLAVALGSSGDGGAVMRSLPVAVWRSKRLNAGLVASAP
jgi:hypothetical protein